MAVSIEQAAANALAAWLASQIGSDVAVEARWPDPEKPLPPKAVTVLLAGVYSDDYLQPELAVERPVDERGPLPIYRWRVLERTQPLQLDVWATYDVVRDDLKKRLDDALNMGNLPYEPVGPGLVLDLGDGWDGKADFIFDAGAITDSPNAVQVSEYRATFSGEARIVLTIDAPSPKQARINLRMRM